MTAEMAFLGTEFPRVPPPHSVLATQPGSVPNSARLTYLSVYDGRDGASKSTPSPSPPSTLTHAHSEQETLAEVERFKALLKIPLKDVVWVVFKSRNALPL